VFHDLEVIVSIYDQYVKDYPDLSTSEIADQMLDDGHKQEVKVSTIRRAIRRARNRVEEHPTTDEFCMGQVCGDETCNRRIEACREHLKGQGGGRPESWGNVDVDDVTMVAPHPHAGKDRAYIHWPSNQYWFTLDDLPAFDIPFEHISKIVEWYVYDGAGLTQKTVTRKVINELDREMTHDVLKRILQSLNVDKNSTPLPPHITQGAAGDGDKAAEKARVWQAKDEAAIEQKYREKEIKHLRKEYKKARQQLMKRREFVQQFLEEANEGSVEVPEFDLDIEAGGDWVPIFVVSDWHIGKSYDTDVDAYSVEVAWKRVREYGQRIVERLTQMGSCRGEVVFAVVGDILDAPLANMYDQQHLGQDIHGYEQCVEAADMMAWLVNFVDEGVPCDVRVECVAGNHGRSSSDRSDDPFRLPEMLTYSLADQKSSADWTLHRGAAGHFKLLETKVILTHGDRTPSEIRDLGYAHNSEQVLVISGHKHTGQIDGATDGNVVHVRGGALCGADDFEQDELAKRFRPVQVMCEVSSQGPAPSHWFVFDHEEEA